MKSHRVQPLSVASSLRIMQVRFSPDMAAAVRSFRIAEEYAAYESSTVGLPMCQLRDISVVFGRGQ